MLPIWNYMFVFSSVSLPLLLSNLIAINSEEGRDFNYIYICSLVFSLSWYTALRKKNMK